MSSRETILQAVHRNRPALEPLPGVPAFETPEREDLVHRFQEVIAAIGGEAVRLDRDTDVARAVASRHPKAQLVASAVPDLVPGNVRLDAVEDPHDLAPLDLFLCRGSLGVAENGAIWVTESHMVHRAAPFLTQHLVIALESERLVWNMHEAYARLQVEEEGFGAFVAGPSKTADIEQALVIGAHGPRSLLVLLI
jgi:L-lactate dehydrogenase complex protein LldG